MNPAPLTRLSYRANRAFGILAPSRLSHRILQPVSPAAPLTTAAIVPPTTAGVPAIMDTRIVRIPDSGPLGHPEKTGGLASLDRWAVETGNEAAVSPLREAADYLRTSDTPVAFPTETVYGLAADATRSASVKGIFAAKGRPSDNPLITHVPDLQMLRAVFGRDGEDPISERYRPLIERFWPGPLTILLPNPSPSKLAPEVTAGLPTVGVRMPVTPLARTLIKLAGVPLAAPSANASTRPSPTTAQHVKFDLDGKIELILDGGPCHVGVESTVVDGLSDPPAVLRPGGVGIDEIRTCPGWHDVVKAYKDHADESKSAPRAPGMKYKHYSPKARVILYEASYESGSDGVTNSDVELACTMESRSATTNTKTNGESSKKKIGVIRTQRWKPAAGLPSDTLQLVARQKDAHDADDQQPSTSYDVFEGSLVNDKGRSIGGVLDIDLGNDTRGIAQGLFSALRELDELGADIIFVDGIEDEIDIAGAVMNRLRKAASEIRR